MRLYRDYTPLIALTARLAPLSLKRVFLKIASPLSCHRAHID